MTTRRPFRRLSRWYIGVLAALGCAVQVTASQSQGDLVFDMLGSAACELPPPGFDARRLVRIAAEDPDAAIAQGRIEGALSSSFVGGGAYGNDDAGGFVLSVQGATIDPGGDAPMLCLALVRLGTSTALSGTIVGEDRIASAPDGAFLGMFRLIWIDADGKPAIVATGRVDHGRLRLVKDDAGLVSGTVTMAGSFLMPGDDEHLPLTASITVPNAENVIRPALRLRRDDATRQARQAGPVDAPSHDRASMLVRATFRIPSNFPQIPLSWSAVPLDEGISPEAWAPQSEMVVAKGMFVPGLYEVSTVGPGEVEFRRVLRIAPDQTNDFVIPLVVERDD
ncbi:hypothetical protein [Shinella sp.]|uniref:hypothetical protein n=1 Tax=Shinella sp. TaxID=1870904 RepID=UPI003F710A18